MKIVTTIVVLNSISIIAFLYIKILLNSIPPFDPFAGIIKLNVQRRPKAVKAGTNPKNN